MTQRLNEKQTLLANLLQEQAVAQEKASAEKKPIAVEAAEKAAAEKAAAKAAEDNGAATETTVKAAEEEATATTKIAAGMSC